MSWLRFEREHIPPSLWELWLHLPQNNSIQRKERPARPPESEVRAPVKWALQMKITQGQLFESRWNHRDNAGFLAIHWLLLKSPHTAGAGDVNPFFVACEEPEARTLKVELENNIRAWESSSTLKAEALSKKKLLPRKINRKGKKQGYSMPWV